MKKFVFIAVMLLFIAVVGYCFTGEIHPVKNDVVAVVNDSGIVPEGEFQNVEFNDRETFYSLALDLVNHNLRNYIGVEGSGECLEIDNLRGNETAFDVSDRKQVMIVLLCYI